MATTRNEVEEAAEAVMQNDPGVQAVVLFGSRATGKARATSDWDVAVISDRGGTGVESPHDEPLRRLGDVDVIRLASWQIEMSAHKHGTLGQRIAREGVVLAGGWEIGERMKARREYLEVVLGGLARHDQGALCDPWEETHEGGEGLEPQEAYRLIEEQIGGGGVAGREREQGTIGAIVEAKCAKESQDSAESQAANLAYEIMKRHPLVDGNKRAAVLLAVEHLDRRGVAVKIGPRALVAIISLVAASERRLKGECVDLMQWCFAGGQG